MKTIIFIASAVVLIVLVTFLRTGSIAIADHSGVGSSPGDSSIIDSSASVLENSKSSSDHDLNALGGQVTDSSANVRLPEGQHGLDDIDGEELTRLIDKHITQEMRRDINQALRPDDKDPKILSKHGVPFLDTSDRFHSVVVAMVDEEEGLVVTDITQPLSTTNKNIGDSAAAETDGN